MRKNRDCHSQEQIRNNYRGTLSVQTRGTIGFLSEPISETIGKIQDSFGIPCPWTHRWAPMKKESHHATSPPRSLDLELGGPYEWPEINGYG